MFLTGDRSWEQAPVSNISNRGFIRQCLCHPTKCQTLSGKSNGYPDCGLQEVLKYHIYRNSSLISSITEIVGMSDE